MHLFVHQLVSHSFFYKLADHPLLLNILQKCMNYYLPFPFVSMGEVNRKPPWGFLLWTLLYSLVHVFQYQLGLSRKAITNTLIDNLFPVPVCQKPYLRNHNEQCLRLGRVYVRAAKCRNVFKLHSLTLPVTFLHGKVMSIFCSGNCSLCNQPESTDYSLLCHFCRSMMRRLSGALCNGHL